MSNWGGIFYRYLNYQLVYFEKCGFETEFVKENDNAKNSHKPDNKRVDLLCRQCVLPQKRKDF